MGSVTRADIELLHGEITREIIGAFFDVYNEFGNGFAELVYHRATIKTLSLTVLRIIPAVSAKSVDAVCSCCYSNSFRGTG